jgi:3-dehydroquinate dehydratase
MLQVRRAASLHLLKLEQQCIRAVFRAVHSQVPNTDGIAGVGSRAASDAAIAGLNDELASYLGPLGDIDDANDISRMTIADMPQGLLKAANEHRARHSGAHTSGGRSLSKDADRSTTAVLVLHGAACFVAGNLAGASRPVSESTVNDLIDSTAAELGLQCTVASSNSDAELIDAVCAASYAAIVVNPAGSSTSLQYALEHVQCPVITVTPGAAAAHWQLHSSAPMRSIAGCGHHSYALGLHAAVQALAAEDDGV